MSKEQENPLIAERRRKLDALREAGQAFPNDFRRGQLAQALHEAYEEWDNERLEEANIRVAVSGRMMAKRIMGKASFVRLQDASGSIQLFLARDALPDGLYQEFKTWDVGDILGAEGCMFKTRTGELSVRVDHLRLLTKSLRPLPEKYHGLTDQETRYRQRYVDLIMSAESRRVFLLRTRMIAFMRAYLDTRGFVEVETPMMQTLPGGANARPFVTHHNALGIDMYLRIAPELFLKRLVVGGMERVYEINRNFRNEGLSTRHNPEFTMLEVYNAYADFVDMMTLTEDLIRKMAETLMGGTLLGYQGESLDMGPEFQRFTMEEALLRQDPELQKSQLRDVEFLRRRLNAMEVSADPDAGPGRLQTELFEQLVEQHLRQPTFITGFPAEVSPLARLNEADPFTTDRFELFIGGREIANGFSELNDPEDQEARFLAQAERKSQGDEEAMFFDADHIRALEYGMPPTAGLGVGVDRLAMFFTDSPSIRDVLLFPHLRPEDPAQDGAPEGSPAD
ncbi:MAG: lysine--tRNA ligase [Gammaproteobacteria bacterium]|nr:MAG: lysine--tRNA ligase [Gammaproteobacteria bacterium]